MNPHSKAIIALSFLKFIGDNFMGVDSKQYTKLIDNIIDSYEKRNLSQNKWSEMQNIVERLEKQITALNFDNSLTMCLAIGTQIAEYFTNHVKGDKLILWNKFHFFCNTHGLSKHAERTNQFQELEKADKITNLILGAII